MKIRTIFKKFIHRKHDKKQSLDNASPISSPDNSPETSPISSPNITTPTSIYTIQTIDCPTSKKDQNNFIYSYSNFNQYNTNANTSISSLSTSLPTSFPPLSQDIQPINRKNTIDQLSNINEESISSSQVSTIPSPSRRTPDYTSLKRNHENNQTKTLINQNNEKISLYPYNSSNSITSPKISPSKDNGSDMEKDSDIHLFNQTKVSKLDLKQLEKEIGNKQLYENDHKNASPRYVNNIENSPKVTISQKDIVTFSFANPSRQKIYESPMSSPENSALASSLSSPNSGTVSSLSSPNNGPLSSLSSPNNGPISPSKKKNHNIFCFPFKKDKKKNKELKTVYQHFSVLDTQSIPHDGLIMVEKQDNAIHNLWEQRNSDLAKKKY